MVQLRYRSFTNISLPTARDFQPKFYGLFFDDVLFFLQIFLLSWVSVRKNSNKIVECYSKMKEIREQK